MNNDLLQSAGFRNFKHLESVTGISKNYAGRLQTRNKQAFKRIIRAWSGFTDMLDGASNRVTVSVNGVDVTCQRRDLVKCLADAGLSHNQIATVLEAGPHDSEI